MRSKAPIKKPVLQNARAKNKSVASTGMVVASFLDVLGRAAAAARAGVGARRNLKQGPA
jgi:hypothetical protein